MMETETLRILEKMEKSKKTYKTLSYFSNPLVVRTHKTTPFLKIYQTVMNRIILERDNPHSCASHYKPDTFFVCITVLSMF